MRLKEKLRLGGSLAAAAIFCRKRPVMLSWCITNRCNLDCLYCGSNHLQTRELDTQEILVLIGTLARGGIRIIRFTGGEPLMRPDIAEIINFSAEKGIKNVLSTNGILLPEVINKIHRLDGISISLDGAQDVHDAIRGAGSFDKAMKALEIVREKRIPGTILMVLCSRNLDQIDTVLSIAKDFHMKVSFQPATSTLLYGHAPNPLAPEVSGYRKAVEQIIQLKKKNRRIINSTSGLRYLWHWPSQAPIRCMAGCSIARIDPAGLMHACNRSAAEGVSLVNADPRVSFSRLKPPRCNRCWCSSYAELNLMSSCDFDAIMNSLRINIFSS